MLTSRLLRQLPPFAGQKVIYGEATTMEAETLQQENIIFKHIPYDIKAR